MRSCVLALALLAAPGLASAQVTLEDTRLSAYSAIGFESPLSGSVSSTVSGEFEGTKLVLGDVSYADVYGALARWHFGVGYRLNSESEIVFTFTYSTGGGSRARIGVIGVTSDLPYVGDFGDIGETSIEAGYRYHLPALARVAPYVGVASGMTHVGRIRTSLDIPGSPTPAIALPVLDSSAAGFIAIGGGIIVPLSGRIGLMADVNLRWRGALNGANVLVGTGLDGIGQDSSRWSMPVVFGAVVRFGPPLY